ncbi:MAG: hypothetical protein MUF62_13990, partial [Chitinophagaceae bacterium]|nr:hypothetical protein [Chitinophagaceae bacterium]
MKKLVILCGCFFQMAVALQAQTKPAKAPTPKEMEAMRRQMQEQLNKLTPEQRKMMQDMGIEVPGVPNLDKAAAIANAHPQTRPGGVPPLNAAKIASVAPVPSPAALPAFVGRLHQAVQGRLPAAAAAQVRQVLNTLKAYGANASETGKAAVGLWLSGRPEMAVLLAGEACLADASLAENINNYAAMLNMMGAQQLAVPLLQCINQQYPGNATILANIGQAWYGMGDIKKADRYLDSAIRRFPKHSQANYTKSKIQEQKGDKAGAAESLKRSMETGYTDEKANDYRRLGYTDNGDVSWPLHIPQDPLGFHKFNWPAFPVSVEESDRLAKEWADFWQQMETLSDEYRVRSEQLTKQAQEAGASKLQKDFKAFMSGADIMTDGPLSARAARKLSYLLDDKDGGLFYQIQAATDALMALPERLAVFDSARAQALRQLDELKCQAGEGSRATDKERCCQITDEANNQWLAASNGLIRDTYSKAVDAYKRLWNAQAYFQQYNMDEPAFEALKAQLKEQFVGSMAACRPNFVGPAPDCKKEKENPFKKQPLAQFDDVNCKYQSTLDLKVLIITTHCSKMTTKVDAGKFKFEFTEDLNKSNG